VVRKEETEVAITMRGAVMVKALFLGYGMILWW